VLAVELVAPPAGLAILAPAQAAPAAAAAVMQQPAAHGTHPRDGADSYAAQTQQLLIGMQGLGLYTSDGRDGSGHNCSLPSPAGGDAFLPAPAQLPSLLPPPLVGTVGTPPRMIRPQMTWPNDADQSLVVDQPPATDGRQLQLQAAMMWQLLAAHGNPDPAAMAVLLGAAAAPLPPPAPPPAPPPPPPAPPLGLVQQQQQLQQLQQLGGVYPALCGNVLIPRAGGPSASAAPACLPGCVLPLHTAMVLQQHLAAVNGNTQHLVLAAAAPPQVQRPHKKTRRGPNRGRGGRKKAASQAAAAAEQQLQQQEQQQHEQQKNRACSTPPKACAGASNGAGVAVPSGAMRSSNDEQRTAVLAQDVPGDKEGGATCSAAAATTTTTTTTTTTVPLPHNKAIMAAVHRQNGAGVGAPSLGSPSSAATPQSSSGSGSGSPSSGDAGHARHRRGAGLSHRQRFRRKLWELHRAAETARAESAASIAIAAALEPAGAPCLPLVMPEHGHDPHFQVVQDVQGADVGALALDAWLSRLLGL
jgi:hypothetical protein